MSFIIMPSSLTFIGTPETYFIVPLVVVFTKFDGQIIQEYGRLDEIQNDKAKWRKARENAKITFQETYLPKFLATEHPPKTYVQLEGRSSDL